MRRRSRMLSKEAIPTIVFSSSMSFVERRTRCERLSMPLEKKIRDYLESSVRVVLYSPGAHFFQFLIVRANAYSTRTFCIVPSHPNFG